MWPRADEQVSFSPHLPCPEGWGGRWPPSSAFGFEILSPKGPRGGIRGQSCHAPRPLDLHVWGPARIRPRGQGFPEGGGRKEAQLQLSGAYRRLPSKKPRVRVALRVPVSTWLGPAGRLPQGPPARAHPGGSVLRRHKRAALRSWGEVHGGSNSGRHLGVLGVASPRLRRGT